jgi:signal transduction histidine kinase
LVKAGKAGSNVRLVITYFLFSLLWIYLSGVLVARIFTTPTAITRAETYKGWAFIAVSTALLFILTSREQKQRQHNDREREELLNKEQQARREAEAANQGKDTFIAVVSHELRTPLTSMVGWIDLLRNRAMPEEMQKHALDSLSRNCDTLVTLVNDLLDSSRIANGKLEISVEEFDFAQMVCGAVEDSRGIAKEKNQQIKVVEVPAHLPFRGDPERLRQVVSNLLNNASKFTPDSGLIRVSLRSDDERVVLSVSDNGIGIESDKIASVFTPFWQGESNGKRRISGLGLGLPLVQHLVQLHGGSIVAQSEGKGKGAVFTVTLPHTPQDNQQSSQRLTTAISLENSDRVAAMYRKNAETSDVAPPADENPTARTH